MIHKETVHQPISPPGISDVYITPSKFSCVVGVWGAHREVKLGTKFSIHTNIFALLTFLCSQQLKKHYLFIFVLLIYICLLMSGKRLIWWDQTWLG
jgi:hypothetical protein